MMHLKDWAVFAEVCTPLVHSSISLIFLLSSQIDKQQQPQPGLQTNFSRPGARKTILTVFKQFQHLNVVCLHCYYHQEY